MTRAGNLWPSIIERGNLVRAFHQAAKGKRWKMEVRQFAADLDGAVEQLRSALLDRTFQTGQFHVFQVHDPKLRTIHAARFVERVFHHALMNLCEPVLERQSVFHSYACRKGKGRFAAIAVAERAAQSCGWQLKLDIRKYFESIPHERMILRLRRVFKDQEVLYWLEKLVRGHRTEDGRGLPIGCLTSQHLANFYLGLLDRHCQRQPGVIAYVRYMDDFVCWSQDKDTLVAVGKDIESCVAELLGLALKHPPSPQPTARGMDFLGYRIFPSHTTLSRRSKLRYRRRLKSVAAQHHCGTLTEAEVQQRLTAMTAFVLPTRSHHFRLQVMEKNRTSAIGHEPGEPGRQLEQQREQLSRREPQQQQPGQHEQQHRVPGGSQLRPFLPDGGNIRDEGLNRSPSCSPQSAGAAVTNAKTQHPAPVDGLPPSRTPRVLIPPFLNPS